MTAGPVPARARRRAGGALLLVAALVGAGLLALWLGGGLSDLEAWASARQREAQDVMAGALRALKAGEPGATAALLGICFSYGVFHAIGPGHGKVLIGAYGYGTAVPLGRLAGLSVSASLAQACTAVLLVWTGITLLDLTRQTMTALTEDTMARISAAMIFAIGLWLVWRGGRALTRAAAPVRHAHHHGGDEACGCGHAHGPTPAEAAAVRGWREAAVLIAGIGARPCSGALFLLIVTWRMGIFGLGVAGTVAMGMGTAAVTLVVAALAVAARRSSLAALAGGGGAAGAAARWAPGVMQLAAGVLVAVLAARMMA